jgi:hypothetical protein
MKVRHVVVALVSCGALLFPAAATAGAQTGTARAARQGSTCSADFLRGDPRLGPNTLPRTGPVGRQLIGYRRTGGMSVADFLARYYDPTAAAGRGGWIYPPAGGYLTLPDGTPVEWRQALTPGQDVDRYGSEYGAYLAPEGLSYAARALPPQSLDGTPAAACDYHDYRVLKPFTVDAGPIAPWFGQPGRGLQYQVAGDLLPGAPARLDVRWLVNNGYLRRLV